MPPAQLETPLDLGLVPKVLEASDLIYHDVDAVFGGLDIRRNKWERTHGIPVTESDTLLGKMLQGLFGRPLPVVAGGTNDEHAFVVFRGSMDPRLFTKDLNHVLNIYRDWWEGNLDFSPQHRSEWPGQICRGFGRVHDIMWPEVEKQVIKIAKRSPKRPWIITGHSLGGAQAILAAYRLKHQLGLPVKGVYVFGSPMVGNPKFVANLGLNIHCFEAGADAIPWLPVGHLVDQTLDSFPRWMNMAKSLWNHLWTEGVEGKATAELPEESYWHPDYSAYRPQGRRHIVNANGIVLATEDRHYLREFAGIMRQVHALFEINRTESLWTLLNDHYMDSYSRLFKPHLRKRPA